MEDWHKALVGIISLAALLFGILMNQAPPSEPWEGIFLGGYYGDVSSYNRSETIYSNVSSTLNFFPALGLIDTTNATLFNQTTANNCTNIRFSDDNDSYPIDFEYEYGCNSASTVYWRAVQNLTNGTNITNFAGNLLAGDGQNKSVVWSQSGYTHVIHFSYNNSHAYDSVDGTTWAHNASESTSAKYGKSINFNGASELNLSGSLNLSVQGQPFTVSMWIRTNESGGAANNGSLFAKRNGSNTVDLHVANSKLEYDAWAGSPIYATSNINNDKWQHVALSYDGTNCRLWVNGTLEKVNACTLSVQTAGGNVIGGFDAAARFYTGLIDEFRTRDTNSTADWLLAEYRSGSSTFGEWAMTSVATPLILNSTNGTDFFVNYKLYGLINISGDGTWNVSYQWYMNDTANLSGHLTGIAGSKARTNIANISTGIVKHQNWTLQINATNGTMNVSKTNSTFISILNSPPVNMTVSAPANMTVSAPANALNTSLITATPDADDADGDALTYNCRFLFNDTTLAQNWSTNCTFQCIPANCTNQTNITVYSYANDGEANSTTTATVNTTILFQTSLSFISPATAYRNTTVERIGQFIAGQNAKYINYTLYVNGSAHSSGSKSGTLLSGTNYSLANSSGFVKGAVLILQTNTTLADDSVLENINSSALTISNFAPMITSLSIVPTSLQDNGTINLTFVAVDIDAGETLSYYNYWLMNGTNTSLSNTSTVANNTATTVRLRYNTTGEFFNSTDLWGASIKVADTAENGTLNTSANITVNITINISIGEGITTWFYPASMFQKNTSLAGQADGSPLFNLSHNFAGTTVPISIWLNQTTTGFAPYCSVNYNQTPLVILNTSGQNILNISPDTAYGIYCWANFSNPNPKTQIPGFLVNRSG